MNFFYAHLIEIEPVSRQLDQLDLSDEQKKHLAKLIDSSIHHTILDAILSELSLQDKRVFLKITQEDDHSKIWEFLHDKIDGIEEKIKRCAKQLQSELHKDLKEAKKVG